jgi:hypothetical protein
MLEKSSWNSLQTKREREKKTEDSRVRISLP